LRATLWLAGIAYHAIYGDPTQPEVWNELDRILLLGYQHQSGFQLNIGACAIDTGDHSAETLEFRRSRMARRFWTIKGCSGFNKPIFPRRADGRHRSKNLLFLAGVDSAKEKAYSRLRIEKPVPATVTFR
jgi:phage terminase large subunit GpA-like protein